MGVDEWVGERFGPGPWGGTMTPGGGLLGYCVRCGWVGRSGNTHIEAREGRRDRRLVEGKLGRGKH